VKILKKSKVMQHLKTINEQEIFYQKYHQKKQEKALQNFLKDYNKTDLMHKQIYIEELMINGHKEFEKEDVMWSKQEKDIEIRKYNRFMPQLFATHEFFEVICVLENQMQLEIVEDKIDLKAGDVVLIPPDTIHKPIVMEDTIAIQIMIRKSTFQKVFYNLLHGNNTISDFFVNALYVKGIKSILCFDGHQDKDILDCCIQLYQENYNQLPGNRVVINNLFEIFICFLFRLHSNKVKVNEVAQQYDSCIIEILKYIHKHYDYITMMELANRFNYSESYLSKYIKRKTGKSFSAIRQEIRMEKACEMLSNSNVYVEDIAMSVGYQNVEHFIRLFKKKHHKTPQQYRNSK
jgi:AraC-like DNA-binding protein/mannose-6-phosphate isomerase-like protein (cupin superfamily)